MKLKFLNICSFAHGTKKKFNTSNLTVILICFLFSATFVAAQTTNFTEITANDITKNEKLSALNISVFGVHLGMKISDVKNILQNNPKVVLVLDNYNPFRYYLYEKISGENKIAIAYMIWDNKTHALKEITLYSAFSKFTIGSTAYLFTQEAFNKENAIVKYFLGNPYKRKILLDIPSIGLKSYAYYFYKNYMITKNISDEGTSYSFSLILNPD